MANDKSDTPSTPTQENTPSFGNWKTTPSDETAKQDENQGPTAVVTSDDGSHRPATQTDFAMPKSQPATQPQESGVKSFSDVFGASRSAVPIELPPVDELLNEEETQTEPEATIAPPEPEETPNESPATQPVQMQLDPEMMSKPAVLTEEELEADMLPPEPEAVPEIFRKEPEKIDPFAWSPEDEETNSEPRHERKHLGEDAGWMAASADYAEMQAAAMPQPVAEQEAEEEQQQSAVNPYTFGKENQWEAPPMAFEEEENAPENPSEPVAKALPVATEEPANPFETAAAEEQQPPLTDPVILPASDVQPDMVPDSENSFQPMSQEPPKEEAASPEPYAPLSEGTDLSTPGSPDEPINPFDIATQNEEQAFLAEPITETPFAATTDATATTDSPFAEVPANEPQTSLDDWQKPAEPEHAQLWQSQEAASAQQAEESASNNDWQLDAPAPQPVTTSCETFGDEWPQSEQSNEATPTDNTWQQPAPEPEHPASNNDWQLDAPTPQPVTTSSETFGDEWPQSEQSNEATPTDNTWQHPAPEPEHPASNNDWQLDAPAPQPVTTSSETFGDEWPQPEQNNEATPTDNTWQQPAPEPEHPASNNDWQLDTPAPQTHETTQHMEEAPWQTPEEPAAETMNPFASEQTTDAWQAPPQEDAWQQPAVEAATPYADVYAEQPVTIETPQASAGHRQFGDSTIQHILEEHFAWLHSGGKDGRRANFRNADLQGFDLSSAQLAEASLRGANISGTNLSAADLRGADLSEALMDRTDIRNANLGAAILTRADLRTAHLAGADLQGADLSGAMLSGANLAGINLASAILQDADLRHVDLTQASLHSANLRGANLTGSNLSAALLANANCRDVCFDQAVLDHAVFDRTNMKNASMQGASLIGVDITAAEEVSAEHRQESLHAEKGQIQQEWERVQSHEQQLQQMQAQIQQREMTLQSERANIERAKRETLRQFEGVETLISKTHEVLERHRTHDKKLKYISITWLILTILLLAGMMILINALEINELDWMSLSVVIAGCTLVMGLVIATTIRSIKLSNNLKQLLDLYDTQFPKHENTGL